MTSQGQIIIRNSSPYENLDPHLQQWLASLKNVWVLWKKSAGVTRMLNEFFSSCINPYVSTLQITVSSGDFYSGKQNSLSYHIMEQFSAWLADKKPGISRLLSEQIKCDAFGLITKQKNHQLVKLVSDVYEMLADRDIFIALINMLIDTKKYKEACLCAVMLQLHDHFTIEDFVVPLIFQDKFAIADEFLKDSPSHQRQTASYLDDLVGKQYVRNEILVIVNKLEVPDVKHEKMYHKPLTKLVARIMKTYNIPPSICPNLSRKQGLGALQFLLHKRFQEKTISDDSWAEMVLEAVGDDAALHLELVIGLSISNSAKEAVEWAQRFNVPRSHWPPNLLMVTPDNVTDASRSTYNTFEEDWDGPKLPFHSLQMDKSNIILIDTVTKFKHMIETGFRHSHVIGIDSEWKPSFKMEKSDLALMQIATEEHIFIIDIIELHTMSPELWRYFAVSLFGNQDIIKLGFNLDTDMCMIKDSLPYFQGIKLSGYSFLDLSILWKVLVRDHKFSFPYNNSSGSSESLSKLVELCFGEQLDKSDQFSNWEKRPLRPNQIHYAALDAYCLIEVYNILKNTAEKDNIPFMDIINEIMMNQTTPKKSKKKKSNSSRQKQEVFQQPRSPHEVQIASHNCKILCDNMLGKLGKNLRKFGIDTIIRKDTDVDLTMRDKTELSDRFVVTRSSKYQQFQKLVPHGYVYCVRSDHVEEQLNEVLEYFKIVVKKEDVFSRCQLCNCNHFLHLSRSQVCQLKEQSSHNYLPAQQSYRGYLPAEEEYAAPEDDYTGFTDSEEEPDEPVFYKEPDDRSWHLSKPGSSLDHITRFGAKILVNDIPPQVLEQIELFYVCEECGKCFWDGSHLRNVLDGAVGKLVSS